MYFEATRELKYRAPCIFTTLFGHAPRFKLISLESNLHFFLKFCR